MWLGLTEKVTVKQKPGGSEGVGPANIWGKSVPGRGTASAKSLRMSVLGVYEDKQGSQYGWSRVAEGES